MVLRIVRLYPLIFLTTVLAGILLALRLRYIHEGYGGTDIAYACGAALLLVPIFHSPVSPGRVYPVNNNLWSLFFELAANIGYAAVVRWLSLRVVTILTILFGIAYAALTLSGSLSEAGVLTGSFWSGIPRTLFPFTMGVLLNLLRERGHLPDLKVPAGVLALVLLACLIPPVGSVWFELAVVAIVFPLTIIACVSRRPGLPRARRLWSLSGRLSYAIYLIHIPLRSAIGGVVHKLVPGDPAPWGGAILIVIILSLSFVATRVFDEPIRGWLRTMLRRRTAIRRH